MPSCAECLSTFERTNNRLYCSKECRSEFNKRRNSGKESNVVPRTELRTVICLNCSITFTTKYSNQKQCSDKCTKRIGKLMELGRSLVKRASDGTLDQVRCNTHRGRYTEQELSSLRADPYCILPNRTLWAQWRKCKELDIHRDSSLFVAYWLEPEFKKRPKLPRNPILRREQDRKQCFRRKARQNPEPIMAELRLLSRNHQYAEDLVVEAFAVLLRLAIPAAEAFKLAKAEVNRTSAQPFREQSFNPEIDYQGRETGRQVARASDISAARHSA